MDNIQSSPITEKVLVKILGDYERLVGENMRMRIGLEAIDLYASRNSLGLWQKTVQGLVKRSLQTSEIAE